MCSQRTPAAPTAETLLLLLLLALPVLRSHAAAHGASG